MSGTTSRRARRACTYAAIAAMAAVFAVYVPGCTVLGLVAGGAADASHAKSGGADVLVDIEPGQHVKLHLWDRSTLDGRFTGLATDSAAAGTARTLTIDAMVIHSLTHPHVTGCEDDQVTRGFSVHTQPSRATPARH